MESNVCNCESIEELDLSTYTNLLIIDIGNENLMCVNRFVIDGLNYLNELKIGSNSFTKKKNMYGDDSSRSFSILNCDEMKSISFGDYGGGFELKNLSKLSRIKIGEIRSGSFNFYYSSFEIEGISMMILNE